jgi:hypothetical protein
MQKIETPPDKLWKLVFTRKVLRTKAANFVPMLRHDRLLTVIIL